MYLILLILHSLTRWGVIISLTYSIAITIKRIINSSGFSKKDSTIYKLTVSISHMQLIIGFILYIKSPITRYFWLNSYRDVDFEIIFFSLFHSLLMICAVLFITVGYSFANRKKTSQEKFKIILIWFSISIILIFIAIPWPHSIFPNRPFLRY